MVSLLFYADPMTLVGRLGGPLAGQALALSLGTTAAALVLAVATGTPLAYWLAKHDFPGKRVIELGLLNRPAFDRRFVLPAVAEEVIMVSP